MTLRFPLHARCNNERTHRHTRHALARRHNKTHTHVHRSGSRATSTSARCRPRSRCTCSHCRSSAPAAASSSTTMPAVCTWSSTQSPSSATRSCHTEKTSGSPAPVLGGAVHSTHLMCTVSHMLSHSAAVASTMRSPPRRIRHTISSALLTLAPPQPCHVLACH